MKILILLCVLYMAWMPVSFGIQGLHFKHINYKHFCNIK